MGDSNMELTIPRPERPSAVELLVSIARPMIRTFESALAPLLDLGIRLFVAWVFFTSGLTKIASWDSTLALFENEYSVPLLPPHAAAYAGAFTELFFPVLMVLGLAGRFAAGVLFVFNVIAVISYPDLGEVGRMSHEYWGLLLLVTLLHGPGKVSIDHFVRARFLGKQ
jgi:putative oxidoreductase